MDQTDGKEFPKRVRIDITATLAELFVDPNLPGQPPLLVKDLQEHQQICPTCKGLWLVRRDTPYGLEGQSGFPYFNEYIGPCTDCYFGVQTLCAHCGKLKHPSHWQCPCPAACAERREIDFNTEQERRAKCRRIALKDYTGTMVFEPGREQYIDATDYLDPELTYFACTEAESYLSPDPESIIDRMNDQAWEAFGEEGYEPTVTQEGRGVLEDFLTDWTTRFVDAPVCYYPNPDLIVVVPASIPVVESASAP